MEVAFAEYGPVKEFDKILGKLEEIVREGRAIIDPAIPPKPLIGMVGEIYLRTQVHANQDVIRVLERYGAEVVNASICEWVNYTTYDGLRDAKIGFRLNLKQFRLRHMKEHLKNAVNFGAELFYQQSKQRQVYKSVRSIIDMAEDHKVAHLEEILKEQDLFSFDVGTEACLSIPGIVEYAMEGYNGVVNVYPFTCMPSTLTSAIVRPLMNKLRIPYLDTPYDSSFQPGREAAIRTFMYQAHQHFKRNGRKNFSGHR
jgi:predicted nucleotide-binding protein (sugar kinase/HSP70/actin superfamily)